MELKPSATMATSGMEVARSTWTLVVQLWEGFEGSLMVSCRALLAVMTSNDRSQMALGGQFHCSKAEQVSVIHMHICLVQ